MAFDDPRQKVAISGMVSGLFFSFSFILIATLYFPFSMPDATTPIEKLTFALQCLLFAAIPLATGISATIIRKCLRPTSLDGEPITDGSRLDIHIRFTRDTTHHLLLFAVVLLNLAIYLEGDFLRILPVLTSWFMIARVTYWGAYLISPPHRLFGATATLAPSLFFLVVCLLKTISGS